MVLTVNIHDYRQRLNAGAKIQFFSKLTKGGFSFFLEEQKPVKVCVYETLNWVYTAYNYVRQAKKENVKKS